MYDIRLANTNDLNEVTTLFNDFRKYLKKDPSTQSLDFLKNRIKNNETVILVATDNNKIVGYSLMYFTYSTVTLSKMAILSDLYIMPDYRRKKIATRLIDSSIDCLKKENCLGMQVLISIPNMATQDLFKKKGYKKDNDNFTFNFYL